MIRYILCTVGIVGSLFMIKQREMIGDILGEAEWMKKIGGVYHVIVYIALFFFFWSIAELTGTTTVLFRPLQSLIPGLAPDLTNVL